MRTYYKTFARMFKRHLTRLVSVILMVLVSVGFTAGIGMSTEKMIDSLDEYAEAANVSDLIVKSKSERGFTEEEIASLTEKYGEENVLTGSSLEVRGEESTLPIQGLGEGITRIYLFSEEGPRDLAINIPEVNENGVTPSDSFEFVTYAERNTRQLTGFEGDRLTMPVSMGPFSFEYDFVFAGTVTNPLHFTERYDVSMQFEGEELSHILYIFNCAPLSAMVPKNDIYITISDLNDTIFSGKYMDRVNAEKAEIEAALGDGVAVLTLKENYSFSSFQAYAEKIDAIGYVITVVFLLVTLLVVLSTMTRLLEEERGQIACMQTLGYSPLAIVGKYLLFALIGTLIGGAAAYFAGEGLSYIIYVNFEWVYALPPYSVRPAPKFFIFSALLIALCTLIATFATGMRKMRDMPATLLRPHTPKAGRKVILERIPLLWNRLSFKYKSTLRNVLRFRMRFAMTVVAVMASTGLVFAGLSVVDCCLFQNIGTTAMLGVAAIVLVFAALLNAVVIYTLTNINISERNRELATLMVLGYQTHEVDLYIYREIYITSAIGIVAGLPFGCLLCLFIFRLLEFGSVGAISWFVWIAAALLSLLFTFIVTLMLKPKIKKIDMNESLKAIE